MPTRSPQMTISLILKLGLQTFRNLAHGGQTGVSSSFTMSPFESQLWKRVKLQAQQIAWPDSTLASDKQLTIPFRFPQCCLLKLQRNCRYHQIQMTNNTSVAPFRVRSYEAGRRTSLVGVVVLPPEGQHLVRCNDRNVSLVVLAPAHASVVSSCNNLIPERLVFTEPEGNARLVTQNEMYVFALFLNICSKSELRFSACLLDSSRTS